MSLEPSQDLLGLTAEIVSAHVAHNHGSVQGLPELIRSVYQALSAAGAPPPDVRRPVPAVPVTKSVFPDFIVSLEDGRKLKMLKRYLRSAYGMTPEQYRARWNLPPTYPMIAPNYASYRSVLAKASGRGRKPAEVQAEMAKVTVQPVSEGVSGKRAARTKQKDRGRSSVG